MAKSGRLQAPTIHVFLGSVGLDSEASHLATVNLHLASS